MKRLIIPLVILTIIVSSIIVISNKTDNQKNHAAQLNIITSVYPIYDFTKEIIGDKANVQMLLSPGVELHDYEPTPQDIINIENSDLFLYTGQELEPWAKKVVSGTNTASNLKNVTTNIELIEDHDHDEAEKYDGHIWLDPEIAIQIVKNITDEVCNIDKSNESYYRNNSKQYIEKLENLDNEFKTLANNSKNKTIAFGGPFSYAYFIKRYDFNYVSAYDSCGEGAEPSTKDILNVINEIKSKNIPVIFYKELSSGNIVNTIVQETGCKKLEFNSLHSITKEQLDNNENYLSIMQKNLDNLKEALQ